MSTTDTRPLLTDEQALAATDDGIRRALHYIGIVPRMTDLEASNIMAEAQLRNSVQSARARERAGL